MSDDLISRQAAIGHAISGLTREIDGERWIRVAEVRESLKTMPSAQRWIPVSERLPKDETKVLVTVFFHGVKDYSGGWNAHIKPSFYVDIAEHYDDEWHSDSDEYKIARNRHEVIAWMPLPEPYKEDKDDAET